MKTLVLRGGPADGERIEIQEKVWSWTVRVYKPLGPCYSLEAPSHPAPDLDYDKYRYDVLWVGDRGYGYLPAEESPRVAAVRELISQEMLVQGDVSNIEQYLMSELARTRDQDVEWVDQTVERSLEEFTRFVQITVRAYGFVTTKESK